MDLLRGDYIVSNLGLEQTWERILKAIEQSSSEGFTWNVYADKALSRLTATMEYQKKLRLKRTLLLEINFFPSDERVRLELHYNIQPMLNIVEPENILRQTVDNIAAELGTAEGSEPAIFSGSTTLPSELAEISTPAEGKMTAVNWIEILLAVNVLFLFFGAFTGNFTAAVQTLILGQIIIAIPLGIIALMYREFSKVFAESKPFKQQSVYQRIIVTTASISAGVFICLAIVPVIAFGLCIGFLFTIRIGG